MHIRNLFLVSFISFACFAILGCNMSHMTTPMADAGPVLTDAPATPDAGRAELDAGPMTTVDIMPGDMPAGDIPAGDGEWHEVARAWIGHDQDLSAICLELDGDPADITDVAIASLGPISRTIFMHGVRMGGFAGGTRVCVELDEHITTLPLIDSRVNMLVLVRTAPLASGSSFRIGITGADRILDDAHYRVEVETLWSNRFEIL
jgi:hypothetical protein